MKKIIMALAMAGILFAGAEAQVKKKNTKETTQCVLPYQAAAKVKPAAAPHPKRAPKTATRVHQYQVCRNRGGYYTCCVYKNTRTTRPAY